MRSNTVSFITRSLTRDEVSSTVWQHARTCMETDCIVTIAEICEMVALQKMDQNLLTDFKQYIFCEGCIRACTNCSCSIFKKHTMAGGSQGWFVERNIDRTPFFDIKWLADHSQFIFRSQ